MLLYIWHKLQVHQEHWWNIHRNFWRRFLPIWHHLQVNPENPCPPRLLEETWKSGKILTWFQMSDFDETFTKAFDGCSLPSGTTSKFIRNVQVFLDSRKRLGWHRSFHGCSLIFDTNSQFIRNLHDIKDRFSQSFCQKAFYLESGSCVKHSLERGAR